MTKQAKGRPNGTNMKNLGQTCWCSRAEARSAPTKWASIKPSTKPASSRIGWWAPRSAPSTPASSPAMRRGALAAAAGVLEADGPRAARRIRPGGPGHGSDVRQLAYHRPGHRELFTPNPLAFAGVHLPLGTENAGFYGTAPLEERSPNWSISRGSPQQEPRLTVGAANVRTGEMRYFDSRDEPVTVKHVMASGALPPAFPAVRIGDDLSWDGGILFNTPVEVGSTTIRGATPWCSPSISGTRAGSSQRLSGKCSTGIRTCNTPAEPSATSPGSARSIGFAMSSRN